MSKVSMGNRLAETFYNMDIIKQKEIAIYSYLFNYLFGGILYDVCILFIGLLINQIDISLCYILTTTPLRQFAGGYHAKTPLRCEIISYLTYFLILILSTSNICGLLPPIIYIITYILCWTVIFRIAPVDTAAKRLSLSQKRKLKSFLIITFLIMTFISFLFLIYKIHLFITVCMCVIIFTIGLYSAYIINARQETF
ncbi:MAG: accessory gene regulator B family protein [Lachnospiraceae bacterium]|nr:accessory gene regulator B family protein [Lachnospiraceae bacterium]